MTQAPVSLPSLQEMIATAECWAGVRWMEGTPGYSREAERAILALLQSIAAPDEAMVERLSIASAEALGWKWDCWYAEEHKDEGYEAPCHRSDCDCVHGWDSDHPHENVRVQTRAVLSALSGEAR